MSSESTVFLGETAFDAFLECGANTEKSLGQGVLVGAVLIGDVFEACAGFVAALDETALLFRQRLDALAQGAQAFIGVGGAGFLAFCQVIEHRFVED